MVAEGATAPQPLQQKLVRVLASLPDYAANAFGGAKEHDPSGVLTHESHFATVMAAVAAHVAAAAASGGAGAGGFDALVAKKVASLGHARAVVAAVLPLIQSDQELQPRFGELLRTTGSALDNILEEMLRCCDNREAQAAFVGTWKLAVLADPHARFLLAHKYVVVRAYGSNHVLETIMATLGAASLHQSSLADEGDTVVFQCVTKVLEVWGDESAIRSCSNEHLLYLAKAILLGLAFMPECVFHDTAAAISQGVVQALQHHISNSDPYVRQLGYAVGEAVTSCVGKEAALIFNIDKDAAVTKQLAGLIERQSWHLSAPAQRQPPPTPEGTAADAEGASTAHSGTTPLGGAQVGFHVAPSGSGGGDPLGDTGEDQGEAGKGGGVADDPDDPDAPFFALGAGADDDDDAGDGAAGGRGGGGGGDDETDSDDNDDEFEPYDMPDDSANPNVAKPPSYVRDALKGLHAKDDSAKVEVCFRSLAKLVRAKPADLPEIAVQIARALLHLTNEYALEDFDVVRMDALVAVTAACPVPVGQYITAQFYERNYATGQRLIILDAVIGAANELSSTKAPPSMDVARKSRKGNHAAAPPHFSLQTTGDDVADDHARRETARQIVQKRIDAKTRRFASPSAKPVQGVANRFSDFIGHLFFPLLTHYDRSTATLNLTGRDSLLLGRLIYTLAAVVHSAGASPSVPAMGAALLEVVLTVQNHTDTLVRRSIAFAMLIVFEQVHPSVLLSSHMHELRESQTWLNNAVEHDPDARTRELALAGLYGIQRVGNAPSRLQ